MIIVCTSDEKYLKTFNAFAYSLNKNSPATKIVCRFVGSEDTNLKQFKNCRYLFDNIKLRTSYDIFHDPDYVLDEKYDHIPRRVNYYHPIKRLTTQKAAYCTGIKYDTIFRYLVEDEDIFVYCDVDTIVRKDLSDLEKQMRNYNADIGIVTDIQSNKAVKDFNNNFDIYKKEVSLKTGGLIVFRKTNKTKLFLKYCKDNIDLNHTDGDEIVFDEAVKKFNPVILKIPLQYKDEGGANASNFDKNSFMWSGHNEIKDFSSDYNKEAKKYLKVVDSIL